MSNEQPKWKTICISKGLHDEIQQFVQEHREYRSMNDVVSESVRLRFLLEKLGGCVGLEKLVEIVSSALADYVKKKGGKSNARRK